MAYTNEFCHALARECPKRFPFRRGTLFLDRYRIRAPIAFGGISWVWSAFDLHANRPVAIKVLRRDGSRSRAPDSVIATEARLLARIDHAGVVDIYEIGRRADLHYLVMELIHGTTLGFLLGRLARRHADMRDDSPLRRIMGRHLRSLLGWPVPGVVDYVSGSWCDTAVQIMIALADAVEAAHTAGVMHRDIKSTNVMLRRDASPVLVDFGLGCDMQGDRGSERLGGSLRCLAPEQVRQGRMGAHPRTDIYQLGLLLYEMLTLRHPFDASDAGEVLGAIRRGRVRPPIEVAAGCPQALDAVCRKAMAFEPALRYQTAGEMRFDLESFLSSSAGATAPVQKLFAISRALLRRTAVC